VMSTTLAATPGGPDEHARDMETLIGSQELLREDRSSLSKRRST
jgi:hypothetical protein